MFKLPVRNVWTIRWPGFRQLSQQQQLQDPSKGAKSGVLADEKKFNVDLLPREKSDNFLIEFNKRKPTYDQLFEYQIDEKNKQKPKPFSQRYFLSADVKIFLTKKYDPTFAGFKRFLVKYLYKKEAESQKYMVRRHGILGPDLATSHFILGRGGKVRFKHKPDVWVLDLKSIPNVYDKKYRLLSIDASNLKLLYEGLDNFILLHQLEELNLSGNYDLDDWACEKLARIFRGSTCLTYLNISNSPLITHRGIEVLHKIRSLKTLVIKETKAANYSFIELLILMFQEVNPDCNIVYK